MLVILIMIILQAPGWHDCHSIRPATGQSEKCTKKLCRSHAYPTRKVNRWMFCWRSVVHVSLLSIFMYSRAKRSSQLGAAQTATSPNLTKATTATSGTPAAREKHASATLYLSSEDDNSLLQAIATLEELDWCLEQLETMQTHKSVSDLASLKVKTSSPRTDLFTIIFFLCESSSSVCSIKNSHTSPKIINRAHKSVIISIRLIQVREACSDRWRTSTIDYCSQTKKNPMSI